MQTRIYTSIHDIPQKHWNALWPHQYPFTQHGFFSALEQSGSIDSESQATTGWQPFYITIEDNNTLIAAAPLFLKQHSYGEYVFDWGWADAYHRVGLDYYPKLINAIPFTPASGPRLGIFPTIEHSKIQEIKNLLIEKILELSKTLNCSGTHCLFPIVKDAAPFEHHNFFPRYGCQYHWFNHDYDSFDNFLEQFSSRKRKNVKKERQLAASHGLEIQIRDGTQMTPHEWQVFYALYHRTYLKRSGRGGYLGENFFQLLAQYMPEQMLLVSAKRDDQIIAAALYFRDEQTLYGRYWGTRVDLNGLHFECCYYQGIEYVIANKLTRFDPGAQGEHKIQRGFTPILTQSFHHIHHPEFSDLIEDFTVREAVDNHAYIQEATGLLPFKEGARANMVESSILIK